jgi:hypothetical protein
MNLGSQAVKDVVATANAFVLSCAKEPLDISGEQRELFLQMHGALYFLQELVENNSKSDQGRDS